MSRRDLVLGLLGAPSLWLLHFGLSYLLVTLACAGRLPAPTAWLLAATAAAILASTWLAMRAGRPLRSPAGAPPDATARLLAHGTLWLTAGFTLLLLLEALSFLAQSRWCS